jgi:enoyl-CoA hydratase/carnithine racemase
MSNELVTRELVDGVLIITLNRPEKRNALSPELFAAIGDAFEEVSRPEVNVVLLRAAGPIFCAGIDLNSLGALAGSDSSQDFHAGGVRLQEIFMALERAGKPSVCAVRGAAVGAGLQLALACDLRVAADDVRLGLFEIRYGIVPDLGGIHRVVRLCGPSRAKDMIMTGREVSGEEALRIGLVDRVVPASQVEEAARALVHQIAARAPLAVRAGKRLADAAAGGESAESNLRSVLAAQLELLQSTDFVEAISSGVEGREPAFTGR